MYFTVSFLSSIVVVSVVLLISESNLASFLTGPGELYFLGLVTGFVTVLATLNSFFVNVTVKLPTKTSYLSLLILVILPFLCHPLTNTSSPTLKSVIVGVSTSIISS